MRMIVEDVTGRDMLDLTWVRVCDVMKWHGQFYRIRSGNGLTQDDVSRIQKDQKKRHG